MLHPTPLAGRDDGCRAGGKLDQDQKELAAKYVDGLIEAVPDWSFPVLAGCSIFAAAR
jgi:hypothetical protein